MNKSVFDTLYKKLNTAQKKAVDTIDGAVMVVAGPGTGKTSILTLRIAHILLQTDTQPENILALTFTESGVYAMRKKLVSIIGTAGYKVKIHTFHGFCNEVIKQYPEKFPRIIGSRSITEIDQIALMEEIINGLSLEYLKPYGDVLYYVKPALSEIRTLKREAINTEAFRTSIVKQEKEFEDIPEKTHSKGAHKGKMKGEFIKLRDGIEKNKELLILYEKYEEALVREKLYDFEDMIVEVVKTLKNDADLLLMLQENHQYILADEHQDANNSQNSLLELLSSFHENPNLFIVGDEKQAIYRFQGASLENFLYFKKIYPHAVLIDLEDNYRSTQTILNASHNLISHTSLPQGEERKKLQAQSEKGLEVLTVCECTHPHHEYHFVISKIQDILSQGVAASDIAVLYRDNKDAFPLAHAFERTSIPYRVESDNDILKDENIKKILLILECIHNLNQGDIYARTLFIDFFNLDTHKVFEALRISSHEKKSIISVVSEFFPDLSRKLSSWSSAGFNKSFLEVLEIVIKESGYLEYILRSPDSLEKMSTLEAFFNEMKKIAHAEEALHREYTLQMFIEHLTRIREHGILTKMNTGIAQEGVRMMTAHKSKGLEFEYVFIIGVNDGHWGNKVHRKLFTTFLNSHVSTESRMDDERRLFYVALTRARKKVYISYSTLDENGKEQLPSQFINEIPLEYKEVIVPDTLPEHGSGFVSEKVSKGTAVNHKEYLQKIFLEQGLSVTSLNNYLTCPWQYFFVNLIRLPRAQSKHQMYGTAVHATLRTFFDKYMKEEDMTREDFLNLFEHNLHATLLSPHDYEDSLKKGRESLGAYFDTYNGTWNRSLLTEFSVQGVHLNIPHPDGDFDLLLKGQLDKIEFIDDVHVNVVDFKTGKKKSDSKENYHRQLVFYKILLDLDEKKRFVMRSGELDFVEPDAKGKFSKERYEISEADVSTLTTLIQEKARDIYSLSFWDTTCDTKDCEYCTLAQSLKH